MWTKASTSFFFFVGTFSMKLLLVGILICLFSEFCKDFSAANAILYLNDPKMIKQVGNQLGTQPFVLLCQFRILLQFC